MFRRTHRTGFTLIELMVVIGIIGLLVAIALPAFSRFRTEAKRTATQATLSMLDLGIIAFRTDSQLGGNFPISYNVAQCASPYSNKPLNGVNGAELLAWALVGADQLGTPGFKNVNGTAQTPDKESDSIYGGWTDDSGNDPTLNQLYALYPTPGPNAGQPMHHRSYFVDISKVQLPTPLKDVSGTSLIGYEIEADKTPGKAPFNSVCFLDSFGQPILYYRANRTAQWMASCGVANDCTTPGPGNPGTPEVPTGIYDLTDNLTITGAVRGSLAGMDFGGGSEHPLANFIDPSSYPPQPTVPLEPKSFQGVLQNMKVTAKRQPHRDDSFLLISAGPDGLYGTGDDVANFPLNQ